MPLARHEIFTLLKAVENRATYRQLVKLAHVVFVEYPEERDDVGALMDRVKWRCSRAHLTFDNSGQILRALNAARWQRGQR